MLCFQTCITSWPLFSTSSHIAYRVLKLWFLQFKLFGMEMLFTSRISTPLVCSCPVMSWIKPHAPHRASVAVHDKILKKTSPSHMCRANHNYRPESLTLISSFNSTFISACAEWQLQHCPYTHGPHQGLTLVGTEDADCSRNAPNLANSISTLPIGGQRLDWVSGFEHPCLSLEGKPLPNIIMIKWACALVLCITPPGRTQPQRGFQLRGTPPGSHNPSPCNAVLQWNPGPLVPGRS